MGRVGLRKISPWVDNMYSVHLGVPVKNCSTHRYLWFENSAKKYSNKYFRLRHCSDQSIPRSIILVVEKIVVNGLKKL